MAKEFPASAVLRRNQVEELTGLARSTLYDYIKQGQFPPPIRLGRRAVGWRYEEVETWIKSRVRAR